MKKKFNITDYWECRYKRGGNSGLGSRGRILEFKAKEINNFISKYKPDSILELGCGDGELAKLIHHNNYLGLDISESAINICEEKFHRNGNFKFKIYNGTSCIYNADLVLSMDVIYHLIDYSVYFEHMQNLFNFENKYVMIYSTNYNEYKSAISHMRHRKFTDLVQLHAPNWILSDIQNGGITEYKVDMYTYLRRDS